MTNVEAVVWDMSPTQSLRPFRRPGRGVGRMTYKGAPTAMTTRWSVLTCSIAVSTLLWSTPVAAQSQSPSFRLQPVTIDGGGGRGSSATKQADGSLGQELAVGASASPHFIVQSGFWSFLGSTLVPVVLAANKIPAQVGAVDLTWSGNNAPYDVYRATNCATIFSGVFVATSNNAYTDSSAPVNGLTCYNVLANAPGPLPPPPGSPSP